MYHLGLIGNCQTSALVSQTGSIDWLCMPRPDSPPIFGRLLDPDGGHFSIEGLEVEKSEQHYIPNTNILVTVLSSKDGSSFKITDFCPRFYQHGRMYRPVALFRIVEPLSGKPLLKVSCRPVNGWNKEVVRPIRGNSHLRFDIREEQLRLITNMSLTYLAEETSFSLQEPLYFGLTWSSGVEEDLVEISHRFLAQTVDYWNTWVKHCSIPTLYQRETIRSALTLKLHCFEDTGAILAALTTSLPEEMGKARNWDYRYCWLRDAYFVLSAFHNLGHFEEMEGFLKFILNLVEKHEHSRERLRPVYRLDQSLPVPELEHGNWAGYENSRPVRSGNQAAEHVQNDVYGELILALSPIFFDERFHHLRTQEHEHLLVHLGKLCAKSVAKPDAGLWELRNGWQEHTFSNLMCWAGLDRLQKVQSKGFIGESEFDFGKAKEAAVTAIHAAIHDGSLRNGPKDISYDSALLQLAILRYPEEALTKGTIGEIWRELSVEEGSQSSFLYRYRRKDDFGTPSSAFLICSFWLVQALARTGQLEHSKSVMHEAMCAANKLGLFSEHFLPKKSCQIGNFPQAYSHVGQINAAFAVSPRWEELL